MIRNKSEYEIALRRLTEQRQRLNEYSVRIKRSGLADEEQKRVMDPLESFHLGLREEIEYYEYLNRESLKN